MGLLESVWQFVWSPSFFIPLIFPGFITLMIVLLILIWFERKLTAKVQMRYGPLYIFKTFGGAIQMVADLMKYLFSEFIIPKDADKKVFIVAPILFFTFTLLPIVAIPISSTFAATQSDLTLILVPAIGTLAPLMVILIGWSSNNKYSFIGSLREGYIIMTYEIPMFISLLAMALAYNSLSLIQVVEKQSGLPWGIILNPLAAITFFGTLLMTTSRFPFDISEAESEIVVGPYTEYSGIIFVLCLGAPYVKLYVLSLFYSLVFLGGWNPLFWPLNTNPILPGLAVLAKAALVMGLAVFMRTIYPRFRLDQALRLGWHKLFALSVLSVILSLALVGLGVLGTAKPKPRKKLLGVDVQGHLEAVSVGIKYLFKPRATLMYPEVVQEFSPNYRGMLKFYDDRCISCTLCARICPSGAIKMYKAAKKWPGVNYQRCIFCGFCVDICPVNALEMTSVHDKAYYGLEELVQKPEDWVKGPAVEKAPKKVKAVFDEKRGLKYEPA